MLRYYQFPTLHLLFKLSIKPFNKKQLKHKNLSQIIIACQFQHYKQIIRIFYKFFQSMNSETSLEEMKKFLQKQLALSSQDVDVLGEEEIKPLYEELMKGMQKLKNIDKGKKREQNSEEDNRSQQSVEQIQDEQNIEEAYNQGLPYFLPQIPKRPRKEMQQFINHQKYQHPFACVSKAFKQDELIRIVHERPRLTKQSEILPIFKKLFPPQRYQFMQTFSEKQIVKEYQHIISEKLKKNYAFFMQKRYRPPVGSNEVYKSFFIYIRKPNKVNDKINNIELPNHISGNTCQMIKQAKRKLSFNQDEGNFQGDFNQNSELESNKQVHEQPSPSISKRSHKSLNASYQQKNISSQNKLQNKESPKQQASHPDFDEILEPAIQNLQKEINNRKKVSQQNDGPENAKKKQIIRKQANKDKIDVNIDGNTSKKSRKLNRKQTTIIQQITYMSDSEDDIENLRPLSKQNISKVLGNICVQPNKLFIPDSRIPSRLIVNPQAVSWIHTLKTCCEDFEKNCPSYLEYEKKPKP